MSKRKFGFEGFGINRPAQYNFERSQAPQRLYVPPSSRSGGHDNFEDTDLDNIEYVEAEDASKASAAADDGEIDPLDAFMEGIHEEMRAAPQQSKAKEKEDKFRDDEDDDPVESFLRAKKDVGLTLASEVLQAGYNLGQERQDVMQALNFCHLWGEPVQQRMNAQSLGMKLVSWSAELVLMGVNLIEQLGKSNLQGFVDDWLELRASDLAMVGSSH